MRPSGKLAVIKPNQGWDRPEDLGRYGTPCLETVHQNQHFQSDSQCSQQCQAI